MQVDGYARELELVGDERERRPHDRVQVDVGVLGHGAAGEGEQVGDDSSHARGLVGDLPEVATEFFDASGGDSVVLEDSLHEHREVEHARDRVVDLVCDARRELPERGEAVTLDQLLLRDLELRGAFLDLVLEMLGERLVLSHGLLEAVLHDVDRTGEVGELDARVDSNRLIELHVSDRVRPLDELPDRLLHDFPREEEDEDDDHADLENGEKHGSGADGLQVLVDPAGVEAKVEDAEDAEAGGVGVTGRVAARRLVVDRSDHRHRAASVCLSKDARSGGDVDRDFRGRLLVTRRADLGALVDLEALGLLGGEHQCPVLVEHADPLDALPLGDRVHHLIGSVATVEEHGVPRRARDAARELVRPARHALKGLIFLRADGGPERDDLHGENDHRESQDQLHHQAPRHGTAPSRRSGGGFLWKHGLRAFNYEIGTPEGAHRQSRRQGSTVTAPRGGGFPAAVPDGHKRSAAQRTALLPNHPTATRPRASITRA